MTIAAVGRNASHQARQATGFTLIEVLVALAIVAVGLSAGLRAGGLLLDSVERQEEGLLAEACAENALSEMRLAGRYPDFGTTSQGCVQGGRQLWVKIETSASANPSFRRVQASSGAAEASAHTSVALAPEF